MTTYQELMLSVCFGATMGYLLFGLGMMIHEAVYFIKKKVKAHVVQAISRDLLMNAMKTLSHCFICGHVHDKLIIECSEKVSLKVLCQQMARTPDWMPDILLRADGYVTEFYVLFSESTF